MHDPNHPVGDFPPAQLYLIHGNNEVAVSNARFALVNQLLTPEERDSGLTELTGPGNQMLTLTRGMSEIIGELGTSSFIADSRRVVLIHSLKDLYAGGEDGGAAAKGRGKGKKAPAPGAAQAAMDSLLKWFAEILPTTENVAIFVCPESDERQRMVSGHSPLYRFIKQHGVVVEHREKAVQYEFENLLIAGNCAGAITLFREWQRRAGSDGGARMKMFNTLANYVELLLQARSIQEARAARVPESNVTVTEGFPSMGTVPDFKARKIHSAAQRIPLESLRGFVVQIAHLQRCMYPSGQEDYVPAWEGIYETLIVQLTAMRHG